MEPQCVALCGSHCVFFFLCWRWSPHAIRQGGQAWHHRQQGRHSYCQVCSHRGWPAWDGHQIWWHPHPWYSLPLKCLEIQEKIVLCLVFILVPCQTPGPSHVAHSSTSQMFANPFAPLQLSFIPFYARPKVSYGSVLRKLFIHRNIFKCPKLQRYLLNVLWFLLLLLLPPSDLVRTLTLLRSM